MGKINNHKAGLVLGKLFFVVHLAWLFLVVISERLAEWFINTIVRLHFIAEDFTNVTQFKFTSPSLWLKGILLLVVTYVGGYIIGWLFAYFWNKSDIHR